MPQGERLSAVAKRRRLNGHAITTTTSTSEDSSQALRTSSPQAVIQPQISKLRPRGRDSPRSIAVSEEADEADEANSFSALHSKDVVQFSGFREIERLDNGAVKIRLSRGQKCVISGLYSLWVKEGVAEVLGAAIHASSYSQDVYATELFELPVISALSRSVEFEIRSVDVSLPFWTGFQRYQWISRENEELCETSFYIHGYSVAPNGRGPQRDRSVDTNVMDALLHRVKDLTHEIHPNAPPRIMICGRQCPEADMLITYLINRLLTLSNQDKTQARRRNVVVLDLDQDLPSFTAPGTISSLSVRFPLLGPAFTHLARDTFASEIDPVSILDMQYSRSLDSTQWDSSQIAWVTERLRQLQEGQYAECPMLIKATSLTTDDGMNNITTIAKQARLGIIAAFGLDANATGSLRQSLADDLADVYVTNIPIVPSQAPPLHQQRELLLRSYFYGQGNSNDLSPWNGAPLATDGRHRVWLTYGANSGIIHCVSLGHADIDQADTLDALSGCVVVIDMRQSCSPRDVDSAKSMPAYKYAGHGCLGLGIVDGIDKGQKQLCLITPLAQEHFDECARRGVQIHLVAQAADNEGRFDMSWLQLDQEMTLEDRKLNRAIYRRRLHVKQARHM